ncbi:MAG: DUF6152 family protein [Caulobacteraceae bacterium]
MRKLFALLTFICSVANAGQVSAHHSFAIFFGGDKTVSVTGTVTEFTFANPHGVIAVSTKNAKGEAEIWKAESNSPSILRRRGWEKDSLKVGDVITVEGWPARDGSKYMRMRKVTKDGKPVGVPFENLTVN